MRYIFIYTCRRRQCRRPYRFSQVTTAAAAVIKKKKNGKDKSRMTRTTAVRTISTVLVPCIHIYYVCVCVSSRPTRRFDRTVVRRLKKQIPVVLITTTGCCAEIRKKRKTRREEKLNKQTATKLVVVTRISFGNNVQITRLKSESVLRVKNVQCEQRCFSF